VFEGFPAGGYLLINSAKGFTELGLAEFAAARRAERLAVLPASRLAREHLGRPVPNAALLGGFAAITGQLSLDAVDAAIRQRFPARVAAGNQAAARAAFALVRAQLDGLREVSRA
jgi:pyruvate ferredoxin oxidoreductase gamma subunit